MLVLGDFLVLGLRRGTNVGGGWITEGVASFAAWIEAAVQDAIAENGSEEDTLLLLGRLIDREGGVCVFGFFSLSSFLVGLPSSPIDRVGRPSGGGKGAPTRNGIGTRGTRKRALKPELQAGGLEVIPEGIDCVLVGQDLQALAVSEGPQNQTGTAVAAPLTVWVTTLFAVKPEKEE